MTIKEILIQYSKELENISDTPRLDVEMLLKKALGDVDSMYIRMYLDKQLTEEQEKYFLEMIKERLNERPIAYIIGNREFMGLDFFVQEGVLIPRPDTETLVEEIINICNNRTGLNILDIGTGSGAITISLAKYLDKSHVISADISDIALEIASKNAISNNVDERIDFIKSDVFSNVPKEEKIPFLGELI
jgi:release factor glutamine methyltransferase